MKNYVKTISGLIFVSATILSFTGCLGKNAVSPQKQVAINKFKVEDINIQIKEVNKAKKIDNLMFFSPVNFKKAEDLAYKSLEMKKDGEEIADIYDSVQESKQFLEKAYNTKKLIQKELSTLLEYKEKFDKLHASKLYKEQYENINENIKEMINDVDNDEGISSFDIREETLQEAKALYSKIKISNNLHSVKNILQNIDKEIAPALFQKAKAAYEKAKFTINKFPDNDELINNVSTEALNSALYAQTIELESKKLMTLEDESIEFYLSNLHEYLISIDNKLEKNDKFKTSSIESKFNKIKKLVSKIVDTNLVLLTTNKKLTIQSIEDNNNSKTKIDELTTQNLSLSAKIATLNAEMLKSKNSELAIQNNFIKAQKTILELKAKQDKKSTPTNIQVEQDKKVVEVQTTQNDTKTKSKIKIDLKQKIEKPIVKNQTIDKK